MVPELFKTSLEKARAVIVDITGYNANVMYELGHVHAKNIKPLIIIRDSNGKTSTINDLPFYIKQEMIISGNDTERGYAKIKLAVEKGTVSAGEQDILLKWKDDPANWKGVL